MFSNILSRIKEKIQKINKKVNLKNIAVITIIIVCFFAFNLSGLLNNVFTSLANLFTNVDGEIKELVIESEGYDTEGGSYKITKKGNWVSSTEVELEYELKSVAENNGVDKDVVLVLDISKSMEETRIEGLKSATSNLVKTLLSKNDNKVGIVSFSTSAKVETKLTNDETVLLNAIEGLTPNGDTSYYQALLKLEELLKGYQEVNNRELIVIFITDGYPNIDTPNERAQYQFLKNEYPTMIVHGIRYETGNLEAIKTISDYQYSANDNLTIDNSKNEDLTLIEILNETALSPEYYETFQVEETINNEYFDVKEEDITVSIGDVEIVEENGTQKIVWTSDGDVRSGSTQKMSIKLTVKDGKQNTEGLWSISTLTETNLTLTNKISHRLSSTESLKLKSGYKVKYEANAPTGCNATINLEETHYAYENVRFTDQQLECDGYQFGGWEVAEEVVTVNDDVFQMPTYNVTIKGIWKQLSLDKTMDGEVYERLTLYKAIERLAVPDNIKSEYVTSITGISFNDRSSNKNGQGVYMISSTSDEKYPLYYFRGNVNNNNVIFGDYCWKIVRTTETGGIKIVYNGKPNNGKCINTTGLETQIGVSVYNSNHDSPSQVGYMYGALYNYSSHNLIDTSEDLFQKNSDMEQSNYFYGTDIAYDDSQGVYVLISATQKTWESNYDDLVGYYTCYSTGTTCSNVYYVANATASTSYGIKMAEGQKLENVDTIYVSKSYTESNGIYHLNNPIAVKKSDWYVNYENYNDYYVCSNFLSDCTDLHYLVQTYNNGYSYSSSKNNYVYGNNVEFVNGKYILKNTKNIWEWSKNYEQINNYHYTCFNLNGMCDKVYYIYNVQSRSEANMYARYVTLNNGEKIEDALNEMFNDNDANNNDSVIKKLIDNWYKENLIDYSSYLEDAVWCNDRSVYDLGGWNPNGGNVWSEDSLTFDFARRLKEGLPNLSCRLVDSFTVSSTTGNGRLTYPIGLLTGDELMYSGGVRFSNYNYYLYTGETYWLLSPYHFYNYIAGGTVAYGSGTITSNGVHNSYGVRPAISLKVDTEYTTGDGTPDNPYVIKTE